MTTRHFQDYLDNRWRELLNPPGWDRRRARKERPPRPCVRNQDPLLRLTLSASQIEAAMEWRELHWRASRSPLGRTPPNPEQAIGSARELAAVIEAMTAAAGVEAYEDAVEVVLHYRSLSEVVRMRHSTGRRCRPQVVKQRVARVLDAISTIGVDKFD